jgi:hypothetical protein
MKNHCKVYMEYFDLAVAEEIICEKCGCRAVDIHHIQGRGRDKDIITNLMALCRGCHTEAHSNISKTQMQELHNNFLKQFNLK